MSSLDYSRFSIPSPSVSKSLQLQKYIPRSKKPSITDLSSQRGKGNLWGTTVNSPARNHNSFFFILHNCKYNFFHIHFQSPFGSCLRTRLNTLLKHCCLQKVIFASSLSPDSTFINDTTNNNFRIIFNLDCTRELLSHNMMNW